MGNCHRFACGIGGANFCGGHRDQPLLRGMLIHVGSEAFDYTRRRKCRGHCRRDFTATARQLLLYRLKLRDFAAELHALRGIFASQMQRVFERAADLHRAQQRAACVQARAGDARARRCGGVRGHAIQHHRITRLAGQIAPRRDAAILGVDCHHHQPRRRIRQQHQLRCDARERHARQRARHAPRRAVLRGDQFLIQHRADSQRPTRHFQTGTRQQPSRQRGFSQRHRCRMPRRNAQHRRRIRQRTARTTGLIRHAHQRQLGFFEFSPQRRRPAVELGGSEHFLRDVVGEQARGCIAKHGTNIGGSIHFRPIRLFSGRRPNTNFAKQTP